MVTSNQAFTSRLFSVGSLAAVCLLSASVSSAAIQTFTNDSSGFSAAAGGAFNEIGVEGFEDNTLPDGNSTGVGSPFDSSPSTFFPNGLVVPVSLTANGGVLATRNRGEVVGTVVGNSNPTTDLVISFEEADQIKAVGFNPIAPLLTAGDNARFDVSIQLFNGAFMNLATLTPVGPDGSLHFGVTTGLLDSPIAQITFSEAVRNGTAMNTLSGIDNLSVYSLASAVVPEPSMALVSGFLTMVGSVFVGRRNA